MLPFISRTKSPQQVMGTLVKEWMAPKGQTVRTLPGPYLTMLTDMKRSPDKIYHVTVMPCYDKKLEASRQDFYNDVYGTRDVDCVITTGELQLLMQEKGWDLSLPVADEHELTPANADDCALPELLMHPGSSSGSYLQSLLSSVAASSTSLELGMRTVRGADYEEYTLTERASGAVVFRGAKCYGFRNLQNVVRKVGREAGVQSGGGCGRMAGVRPRGRPMKRGDANGAGEQEKGYDYVEVMACPGGCVNGGGQLRPSAGAKKEDAEGFSRDWGENGVKIDEDGAPPVVSGAKVGGQGVDEEGGGVVLGGLPSISLECDAAEPGDGPLKNADRLACADFYRNCVDLQIPRRYRRRGMSRWMRKQRSGGERHSGLNIEQWRARLLGSPSSGSPASLMR
ncbi:Cytosolic Fe-S cluster assembly factor NAR1 [Grifola frondosa]|uniref:Cytosolic Fe-S cluster assembly factor NAR1 n=1 Tax=Grifola frondosa TaxID=5627 RepID=A0A1C7LR03_GRIFR|nr:Cytosolic Fe-S cluster assembly factor NAR1 [Grifola frondosa]